MSPETEENRVILPKKLYSLVLSRSPDGGERHRKRDWPPYRTERRSRDKRAQWKKTNLEGSEQLRLQAANAAAMMEDALHPNIKKAGDSVERVPCWLRTAILHAWFTDTLITLAD